MPTERDIPDKADALEFRSQAMGRLEVLRSALDDEGRSGADPMWYRVLSTQVIAMLDTPAESGKARATAELLCAEMLRKLNAFGWMTRRRRYRELKAFLQSVQPALLILLASAIVRDPEPNRRSADADSIAQYLSVKDSRKSRSLEDSDVVAYVETHCAPLDFEASYNLACYHTRVAALAKVTTEVAWSVVGAELRRSIELGGSRLGDWPMKDPALDPYRADEKRCQELKVWIEGRSEMKKKEAKTKPAGLLARLRELWTRGK